MKRKSSKQMDKEAYESRHSIQIRQVLEPEDIELLNAIRGKM